MTTRFTFTFAAAAALCLLAGGIAGASPKKEGAAGKSACAAGVGKPVCCKTLSADHCPHTPCCEVGNAAFFSPNACATCEKHAAERAGRAKASCAEETASEPGNRAFFTGAASRTAGAACASGACATGEAGKKAAKRERAPKKEGAAKKEAAAKTGAGK